MKLVYYFTAEWCGPCKKTKPIAEELDRDGFATFKFIDVDSEIELAQVFNVQSIPTFILMENGEPVKRIHGAQTKDQLLEFINYE